MRLRPRISLSKTGDRTVARRAPFRCESAPFPSAPAPIECAAAPTHKQDERALAETWRLEAEHAAATVNAAPALAHPLRRWRARRCVNAGRCAASCAAGVGGRLAASVAGTRCPFKIHRFDKKPFRQRAAGCAESSRRARPHADMKPRNARRAHTGARVKTCSRDRCSRHPSDRARE